LRSRSAIRKRSKTFNFYAERAARVALSYVRNAFNSTGACVTIFVETFLFANDQEISMTKQLALSALIAVVAVFSQGAFAQASVPASRAEVKAEAKTGALAPAGQGPGAMIGSATTTGKSTKTRMERKSETKMAKDTGALKPAGDAAEMKDDKAEKMKGGTVDRAGRKAATKAAVKSGTTQPAGETPQPVGEAPKK
jgi:hypothetical protein